VISESAVVSFVLFKAAFVCYKIMKKLYCVTRLYYLSFGVKIIFIALLVQEILSLFYDIIVLSEFWTVLDAFSFIISKV
jgi:hypothetical protein